MQSNNKLTIPDLISIDVFTAIYFMLVTLATFASALLLPGVSNIFLPAIAALISGSVYMLLVAKLQKFGGITIMGLVMGLFFFVSGHFVLSFAANILFGVLADWVASLGKYYDRKLLFVSYILFSYGLTGPILPTWPPCRPAARTPPISTPCLRPSIRELSSSALCLFWYARSLAGCLVKR